MKLSYAQCANRALVELRQNHQTESDILRLLFKCVEPNNRHLDNIIKRELRKAYSEEFHRNLDIYRESNR